MRLIWDATGQRFYETGVRRGVLYPQDKDGLYPKGVAWNGITSISENPTGADPNDLWADDIKYGSLRAAETMEGSIESYTYPEEFEECDGTASLATGVSIGQQKRKPFGLCYRTSIGNDTAIEEDDGYILHLLYGATASPSEKQYQTINDSPEAITFSWDYTTIPVNVTGHKPTALVRINSLKVDAEKLAALEDILYGTDSAEPRLPLPDEIASMFEEGSKIEVPEVPSEE